MEGESSAGQLPLRMEGEGSAAAQPHGAAAGSAGEGMAERRRPQTAVHRAPERRQVAFKGVAFAQDVNLGATAPLPEIGNAEFGRAERRAVADAARRPVAVAERRFPVPSVACGSEVPGLVGLQNLGNTCFMNVVVQCLASLSAFSSFFLDNHHMFSLDQHSRMKGTLALSFGEVLHKLHSSPALCAVPPAVLKERIGKYAPQFTGSHQHDAQELLRFLLDGMHEDLRFARADLHLLEVELGEDDSQAEASERASMRFYNGMSSHVLAAFGGQLASTVTCVSCEAKSVTRDPFLDLSLPIPDEEDSSLVECLAAFTESELLDGENMYWCSGCAGARAAHKTLRLSHLPSVLAIHLKRFSYTETSRKKKTTRISFPEVGLSLAPFASQPFANHEYDLAALALHSGGMAGGHYHALCLREGEIGEDGGGWYHFNDSAVRAKQLSEVDLAEPYILFYRRRDS
ncbi:hypothetical protein T484DRAFT_1955288 [Baffinella frigidus]|nr:hypothetical protein T484DRAFT_1955288 [Cryptophyta sp. CCMP2293]